MKKLKFEETTLTDFGTTYNFNIKNIFLNLAQKLEKIPLTVE